jgi:hypothetical protein
MAALGFGPPKVVLEKLEVTTPHVQMGEALLFDVAFRSDCDAEQQLVVDYVVHHRKANGTTTPKVFKWKTLKLPAGGAHAASRKHAIKPISTRKYYSGEHYLELQVNGVVLGRQAFELTV